jgi:hypothetical protein
MSKQRCIEHQDYYKLPNGIECFDVIRYFPTDIGMAIKYLWRHGRKHESGIDDTNKAKEDLRKAIVCINDHILNFLNDTEDEVEAVEEK